MDRRSLITFVLSVVAPILVLTFVRPLFPLILLFPFAVCFGLVFQTTVGFYTLALIQFPAYSAVWYVARKKSRFRNSGTAIVAFHVVVALISEVVLSNLLGQ